jgi:hypothetical protein
MRLEVTALIGMGRRGGGAAGPLPSALDSNIRSLWLQVAEAERFLWRVLGVDMIADFGLQLGGDLGAAAPQLSLRARGAGGPLEAPGWELVLGQGESLRQLRVPGRCGAVSGPILYLH